ncbi:MAG: hypothetical protein IJA84_05755 [Clostridia bacterium]|nr:hypothetical protein [Clostridia bacterium]
MKKKYLAWMLCAAVILGLVPGQAFAADGDAVTLDLGDGSIVITETGYTQGAAEETAHTGAYIIEKEYVEVTTNTVTVKSGTVDITLADDLNIDVSATSGACAFAVEPGANVTLTLTAAAVFKSGEDRAGLQVPTGASITIRAANRFASLETTGGAYGAGIGGCNLTGKYPGGNITIESGRIIAKGGSYAAGIGGSVRTSGANDTVGANGTGTNESIHISGGIVNARGGSYAAGIGGGGGYSLSASNKSKSTGGSGTGSGGTIIIDGTADVTATGGSYAASIGGGGCYSDSISYEYYSGGCQGGAGTGDSGRILITGDAVVTATGGRGASIGGGSYGVYKMSTVEPYVAGAGTGSNGTIIISGNAQVYVESTSGAGIGGGGAGRNNVEFHGAGTGTDGEILITDNAHVTAVGGSDSAGIGGSDGTGTRGKITIKGNPTVIATGYYAGIGGQYATGTSGAINISDGTVTATATYTTTSSTSGYGRGIGGPNTSSGGAVNISGGHITATGHYAMSAANLYGGTVVAKATYQSATSAFSTRPTTTTSSYPWILAQPGCPAITQGAVFSGTEGILYGDFYLMRTEDREIPEGYTLTVAEGQELVVFPGTTLTVNGTLILEGLLTVEEGGQVVWGENSRLVGDFDHEHNLTATAAKAPSCDSAGCLAHWACSICGAVFTDKDAQNEVNLAYVTIPAQGHRFENNICKVCQLEVEGASVLLPTLSARLGDTVTVPVTLTNNPGLITAKITLNFDDTRLQLVSAEDTGLLAGGVFGDTMVSPYVLTWEKGDQTADNTENGILANLTFKVLEGAAVGTAALTAEVSDTGNTAMESVALSVTDGAVNVTDYFPGDVNSDGVVELLDVTVLRRFIAGWTGVTVDEAAADVNGDGEIGLDDAVILRRHLAGWPGYELPYVPAQTAAVMLLSNDLPVFSVNDVVGRQGDIVTVEITLESNPGIVAGGVEVVYDTDKLHLIHAVDTGLLPGALFGNVVDQIPYRLTWEDGTAADTTACGVVARLTFEIWEEGVHEVDLTAYRGHNFDLEPVIFGTASGKIYGDVLENYDEETGLLTVEPLPEGVLVMAAAYEGGRMVWVSEAAHTETLAIPQLEDADRLLLFFLWEDWKPAGDAREIWQ